MKQVHIAASVRNVVLERDEYVIYMYFLYVFCFFIYMCSFRERTKKNKKTRRRRRRRQRQRQRQRGDHLFFAKKNRSLQSIFALKLFDDICIFIKQNKNDKIKIKKLYIILEYEFFVLSKFQEFNEINKILHPFKLVISFFFSIRLHLLSNDELVSGLRLCV